MSIMVGGSAATAVGLVPWLNLEGVWWDNGVDALFHGLGWGHGGEGGEFASSDC